MKKLTIFSVALFALLSVTSCEKDAAVNNSTALPNGSMLTSLQAAKEAAATQVFTINAEDGGTVVGTQGTRVTIVPGTLYTGVNNQGPIGQPITGNVVITLIEVYERKDMIFMNKPTMGVIIENPVADTLSTLVSGGEYYLKVTYNNSPVYSPSGVYVHLPVENTGGADPMMEQFDGVINSDGNIIWFPTEEAVEVVEVPTDTVGGQIGEFVTCYQILDNQWGWTNVDRFYSYPGEKTLLQAKLPTGFDPSNTEVYITYDNEPRALAALDIYTAGNFSEHYGLIPVGLPVHFIAVTYLDGQLHYAIQGATIEEDHIEMITTFNPTTQSELTSLINALP